MRKCEVKGCENEAIVGWGKNSTWICLDHFNEVLGDTVKPLKKALSMFSIKTEEEKP